MKVILCGNEENLLARWKSAVEQSGTSASVAGNLTESMGLIQNTIRPILIVHRPWADSQHIAILRRRFPETSIMILSDDPNEDEGVSYLKIGVSGYGNSHMAQSQLAAAVKVIDSGGVWVGQKIMRRLIASSRGRPSRSAPEFKQLKQLSDREQEVASLLAEGASNKEIAVVLDITERTVKAHLHSIYAKTGVSGRLQLALLLHSASQG